MESPLGAFFLDSCILLNRVLEEDVNRTAKLFRDMRNHPVLCYLSESVDTECNIKIMKTIDFIGDTLRDFFKGALKYLLSNANRSLDDVFTSDDINLIEEIFITIKDTDVLRTPARNLEEHIINVAENKLNENDDFTFNDLLISITTEVLRLSNILQDKYENIFLLRTPEVLIYNENPDPHLVTRIYDSHRDIHHPDTVHLASVIKYKEEESQNAIFITADNGILRHRNLLKGRFSLIVSDPLYAIHKL